MSHIIQKQLFSLSASDMKQVREWESKLHAIIRDIINPGIDKCFTGISSSEDHIIIDKLEIDLGTLNNTSPRQLEELINAQLRSQLQKYSKTVFVAGKPSTTYANPAFDTASSEQANVQHLTHHKKCLICFLHFLTEGLLPWWAEAEMVNLHNGWINDLSREEANQVAVAIASRPLLVDRLVFQFNEEFISSLLRCYIPQQVDAILQSWKSLATYYSLTADNGNLHKRYWKLGVAKAMGLPADETALRKAFVNWLTSSPAGTNERLLPQRSDVVQPDKDQNISIDQNIFIRLKAILRDAFNEKLIPSAFIRELLHAACMEDERLRPWVLFAGPGPRNSAERSKEENDEVIRSTGMQALVKRESEDRKGDHDPIAGTDEKELYVSGAGLILIHPFLSELFTSTGLWGATGWVSGSSRQRAIQLLTFLTFGKTDVPEYQLSLPKILGDMPLSEPLDTRIDLPEELKRIADELLQAVIGHWKAIGNTSAEGLREGFIQREGKITRKNDDWHLTVGKKAQDILLGRLPWGISFIHLPWFGKSNLHVKWTD